MTDDYGTIEDQVSIKGAYGGYGTINRVMRWPDNLTQSMKQIDRI